jgi:hypothetical protein
LRKRKKGHKGKSEGEKERKKERKKEHFIIIKKSAFWIK